MLSLPLFSAEMSRLRRAALVLLSGGGEGGVPDGALELALEPPGERVPWEELAVLRVLTDARLEEALLVLGGGLEVVPGEWRVRFEEAQDEASGDRLFLAMAAQESLGCWRVGIVET